jgi:DNA-binding IscR family transcriptional regulator
VSGEGSCRNYPEQDEKGDIAMDNYEVIVDFFMKSDKPVKAGEVADATGIDKKEVDKVLAKLKKEGKIVSPKRCFWEIQK